MPNVPTKGSTPQLDALAAFTESSTPSNAVALAIADHRAGALTDWTYVDALRKAQERLEAYPKLVERLRCLALEAEVSKPQGLRKGIESARALLAELGEVE